MLLVVGATALVRRGWQVALAVVSVPGVVYLLWYAKWGRHATAVDQQPLRDALQQAPAFVWRGLVDAVDRATGFAGIGPVILVLLGCWLLRRVQWRDEPWPMVLTLVVAAPLFLFLIDIRRSGLGVAAAGAPRYSYVVIAVALPAVALAAGALLPRSPIGTIVGLVATASLLLVSLTTLHDETTSFAAFKIENRDRIVAAAAVVRSGADLLSTLPSPEFNPDLTVSSLRELASDGDLPDIDVSTVERLTAREFLQIASGTDAARGATARASIAGSDGATIAPSPSEPGCVTVTPTSASPVILLDFSQPGAVEIDTSTAGVVTTQLQRPESDSSVRGRGRSFPVGAHQRLVVSVAATRPWLRLGVPATGPTDVCRLAD
jgi:hypothetical protein